MFSMDLCTEATSKSRSCVYFPASAYGKNFVGGAEHNLPESNLLVTDAQDDSFMFHRHTVRARAFKIVQIFSVNQYQHF